MPELSTPGKARSMPFSYLFSVLLWVFGITSLGAQGVNYVNTSPTNPTTSSNVVLNIEYYLINGCWSYSGASSGWSGNTLNVYLNFNHSGAQFCPQFYTTGVQSIALGVLNGGTYTVRVWDLDMGGALLSTFTFYVNGTSCNAPTSAMLSANNVTSSSFTANTSINNAIQYSWRYKISSSSVWTSAGTTTTNTRTITGLFSGTTYHWQVQILCVSGYWSSWSAIQSVTTQAAACPTPTTSQSFASSITSVSAVLNGPAGYTNTDYQWRLLGAAVWNDLPSTTTNFTSLTGLSPNTYYEFRIAVRCSNGVWSSWSGSKVFLTAAPEGCPTPNASQAYATNITTNSVILNGPSGYLAVDFQYRKLGTATWLDLNGTTGTSIFLGNLLPATTYEFRISVRCQNGIWSAWSGSQWFTTLSGIIVPNDEPCGATTVTPGNACNYLSFTNSGATPSAYPSAPAFSNCPTAGMNDIWIRIPMPGTGKVYVSTIAGMLGDIIVAAYSGSSCSALTAFGCIDDNANGDLMPDFTITSGASFVWLRIWGYNGATGSFSLCVQTLYNVSGTSGSSDTDLVDESVRIEDREAAGTSTETAGIKIFPNPATDLVQIQMDALGDDETVVLEIIDQTGKLIHRNNSVSSSNGAIQETFDASQLPSGSYFVRIQGEKRTISGKFMKI